MRTLLLRWLREGPLKSPFPTKDASPQFPILNLKRERLSPLVNRFRFSKVRDSLVIVSVIRLLSACRPSAVRGLVVPVVVDAVKREFGLPRWFHVLKEVRKLIPAFAYLYSTTSIVSVVLPVWVKASLTHIHPRMVEGVPLNLVLRNILNRCHAVLALLPRAAATVALAVYHIGLSALNKTSTIASKLPDLVFYNLFNHSYRSKRAVFASLECVSYFLVYHVPKLAQSRTLCNIV